MAVIEFGPETHDLRLQRFEQALLLLDEFQQFVVGRLHALIVNKPYSGPTMGQSSR